MISAYAIESVAAAERDLLATLPDGKLMAQAVAGLAEVARLRLRERAGRRVVALVGPGNNGADALYAAATLARDGFLAAAVHLGDSVHAGARAAAAESGVALFACSPEADADPAALAAIAEADVVLDGVLGIGGRPGLPSWARPWVDAIGDAAYVIAVDLPSGQDPGGLSLDPAGVFADETVTFSVPKPVHLLPPTEVACGLLTVVDIGLTLGDDTPAVVRLDRDDAGVLWPVPGPSDDKYSRGVLGVIAGGENYTGAAILAVTAAAECGVGMVRYVGTPTPVGLVRAAVPEAVIGVGRVQAWVIGPGLDTSSRAAGAKAQLDAAREALASDLPVVIDAGGLDLIAGRRDAPTLLTPHAGECARLLTRLAGGAGEVTREAVQAAPLAHARQLAGRTGATVLLKGATTVVVPPDPDGSAYSQNDAPAWLATAGAGDVLAGILGTLLAAGLDPAPAGALGALVHGVAADTANPAGPVRALTVARALPGTIARLIRTA